MDEVSVEFAGGEKKYEKRPNEERRIPIRITFHEGPNAGTEIVLKKGSRVYLGPSMRIYTLQDVLFSSRLESPRRHSSSSANSTRKRHYIVTGLVFYSQRENGTYRTILKERNFYLLQRLERVKKSYSTRRRTMRKISASKDF
jgi:hypothetical protein